MYGRVKSTLQFRKMGQVELYDSQQLQLPKSKAISLIDKNLMNSMILESIEESPGSKAHIKIDKTRDLNFEQLVQQQNPDIEMAVDDEEDGLPKTQEAPDMFVKQNSNEIAEGDLPPIEPYK